VVGCTAWTLQQTGYSASPPVIPPSRAAASAILVVFTSALSPHPSQTTWAAKAVSPTRRLQALSRTLLSPGEGVAAHQQLNHGSLIVQASAAAAQHSAQQTSLPSSHSASPAPLQPLPPAQDTSMGIPSRGPTGITLGCRTAGSPVYVNVKRCAQHCSCQGRVSRSADRTQCRAHKYVVAGC